MTTDQKKSRIDPYFEFPPTDTHSDTFWGKTRDGTDKVKILNIKSNRGRFNGTEVNPNTYKTKKQKMLRNLKARREMMSIISD